MPSNKTRGTFSHLFSKLRFLRLKAYFSIINNRFILFLISLLLTALVLSFDSKSLRAMIIKFSSIGIGDSEPRIIELYVT